MSSRDTDGSLAYTIQLPSGDHDGLWSAHTGSPDGPDAGCTRRWPVPSLRIVQSSTLKPSGRRPLPKTITLPSADHAGDRSRTRLLVSRRMPFPLGRTT